MTRTARMAPGCPIDPGSGAGRALAAMTGGPATVTWPGGMWALILRDGEDEPAGVNPAPVVVVASSESHVASDAEVAHLAAASAQHGAHGGEGSQGRPEGKASRETGGGCDAQGGAPGREITPGEVLDMIRDGARRAKRAPGRSEG